MLYKVIFKHSKTTRSGYKHQYTDWTLAEGDTTEEAINSARQWVKENRCSKEHKNTVKILEVRKIK